MSFNVLLNSTTALASQVNENYYHVAQGSVFPMSQTASGSLSSSNNTCDLGTAAIKWDVLYCNNIDADGDLLSGQIISLYDHVLLSATASSIEFTALNGDSCNFILIIGSIIGSNDDSRYVSFILNGDSATNYSSSFVFWNITVGAESFSTSVARVDAMASLIGGTTTVLRQSMFRITLFPESGKNRAYFGQSSGGNVQVDDMMSVVGMWKDTGTTITSIKFFCTKSAGTASSFDPQTHLTLWKA